MEGYIKLQRSDETLQLLKYPKAFALMALIAIRARRTPQKVGVQLEPGEAFIGDFEADVPDSKNRSLRRNLLITRLFCA